MRRPSLLLATLLTECLLLAQGTAIARDADAPLWSGRNAELVFSAERLSRIDRVLQQYVDEGRIAGAVALVMQDGRPAYERAFGWSDKETGTRMATDSLFRIASQTKAITSAAILSLMEEGKLTLSDPAGKYIPEFSKTTVAVQENGKMNVVPAKRAITIQDLLTHTAGISYGAEPHIAALYEAKGLGPAAGSGWYIVDKNEPVCATMERLATLPFVAQPGEAFVYGYNTDVLGCIVERASGMALDQFIRTRITEPLGMKDTQFYLPRDQRKRLTTVYGSGPDGKIVRAPEGAKGQGHFVEGPRRNFSGGAGLVSTARDYARFLEMTRNGGVLEGVRILAPRTVALMSTNLVGGLHANAGQASSPNTSPGLGFGLGFQTVERYGASGMEAPGAFGWGGAYGTLGRVDPDARLTILFMIQLLPNQTDVQGKFDNLVYQALTN